MTWSKRMIRDTVAEALSLQYETKGSKVKIKLCMSGKQIGKAIEIDLIRSVHYMYPDGIKAKEVD